jgi:hypothetical protein
MNAAFSSAPAIANERPSAGLVLAAPGGVADPVVAGQLAQLLRLRLLPLCGACADPDACLQGLDQEPPGWLLPLAPDPAAELDAGGCWAERLAAWRQPLLLLVPAVLAEAGPARVFSAWLQQERVPLLGLVQLGGPWLPERRRRDGLAWLGWLPQGDVAPGSDEDEALAALRLKLISRWSLSGARAAAPAHPVA